MIDEFNELFYEWYQMGYETARREFYKEGRWIRHHYCETFDRDDYERPSECSECHYRHGFPDPKYCPNCGAKMKKEK